MGLFIVVLVICLVAGIVFLVGPLLILSRLPAAVDASGSMTITWNGITLKTSSVYMALAVVAAVFGLVLPLSMLSQIGKNDFAPIYLSVGFSNFTDPVSVTHGGWQSDQSPVLLPVFRSEIPQIYTLSGSQSGLVQINATYSPADKKVIVKILSGGTVQERSSSADGIFDLGVLTPPKAAVKAVTSIPARHAAAPSVGQKLASIPNPVLPKGPTR